MRLYSRDEFEADIRQRWGLASTDDVTATARIWKTRGGYFVTIPALEQYPDYWLDTIRELIEAAESKRPLPWHDS